MPLRLFYESLNSGQNIKIADIGIGYLFVDGIGEPFQIAAGNYDKILSAESFGNLFGDGFDECRFFFGYGFFAVVGQKQEG